VSYASSVSARIEALVHESAFADPVAFSLHKGIIAIRLLASCVVFAAAPLYLSARGVPETWVIVAFCWLQLPLVSVAVLSRSGSLVLAQAIAAFSLLGFAVTLGLGGGGLAAGAFVCLALAPMEAAFSRNARLAAGVGAISVLAAIVLVLAPGSSALASTPDVRLELILLTTPALIYGAAVAFWSLELLRRRERLEKMGAARLFSLSEALGDLVLHHDRSGAVLWLSRECETLFKLAGRDLMGRGFFERVHVADRPAFLTVIADAADSELTKTATLRLRISHPSDSDDRYEEPAFAWVELRARRIGPSAGSADLHVVAVVRDVTALKRHENELEEARREAEMASAWKDRFLANISHELRTPLNGIIGFSEILCTTELAPKDPAKRLEYAQIIHTSGQHLLSVVNSILDMSKIEAGRFEILSEPFEVTPLIESCCDMVRLKAQEGGVHLLQNCPSNLPELVADKRACKQILINLLSNAVKFTQAGGRVTVGARAEGNAIVLYVSDTGIGIGETDLSRVGDAFFQARSAYDRPFEGTGLGLSVVRGLVGLHGGTIVLESEPGEGTCVTIRMPRDGLGACPSAPTARIDVIRRKPRRTQDIVSPVSVKKIA
jgi:cell cycle sensor histidine kinase DivJ